MSPFPWTLLLLLMAGVGVGAAALIPLFWFLERYEPVLPMWAQFVVMSAYVAALCTVGTWIATSLGFA